MKVNKNGIPEEKSVFKNRERDYFQMLLKSLERCRLEFGFITIKIIDNLNKSNIDRDGYLKKLEWVQG